MSQEYLFGIILVIVILIVFYRINKKEKENYEIGSTNVCQSRSPWQCGGKPELSTLNNKFTRFYIYKQKESEPLSSYKEYDIYNYIYTNLGSAHILPSVALCGEINYVKPVALLYLIKDAEGLALAYKKVVYKLTTYEEGAHNIAPFKSVKWMAPPDRGYILNLKTFKVFRKALKLILYKNTKATGLAIKTTQDIPDLSVYGFESSDKPLAVLTVRDV